MTSPSRVRRGGHAAPWALLGTVLVAALAFGARGPSGPPSLEERVRDVTSEIRCPTCRSQSVADSDAPAAQFIRDDVRQRLADGESEGRILAYLVSRYGDDIRLEPESSGVAGLVWLLPVLGVAAAIGGLALAFRRWRSGPGEVVSDADRARVEEALRSGPESTS